MADYTSGLPVPAGTIESQPRPGIIPSVTLTNSKKKKVRVLLREFFITGQTHEMTEERAMSAVEQVAAEVDTLYISSRSPITEEIPGYFTIRLAIMGQKNDTIYHAQGVLTSLVEETI